jgi:hypothetical protein
MKYDVAELIISFLSNLFVYRTLACKPSNAKLANIIRNSNTTFIEELHVRRRW